MLLLEAVIETPTRLARLVPGGVGADEIADDDITGRRRTADRDPGGRVEADGVGVGRRRPADRGSEPPNAPSTKIPSWLPRLLWAGLPSVPIKLPVIVSPLDSM